MSDNESLLDSDLRQAPRGPFQSNVVATVPDRLKTRWRIMQMILFNFVCEYKFLLRLGQHF